MKPLCAQGLVVRHSQSVMDDTGKVPASDAGKCDDHRKVDVREFPGPDESEGGESDEKHGFLQNDTDDRIDFPHS